MSMVKGLPGQCALAFELEPAPERSVGIALRLGGRGPDRHGAAGRLHRGNADAKADGHAAAYSNRHAVAYSGPYRYADSYRRTDATAYCPSNRAAYHRPLADGYVRANCVANADRFTCANSYNGAYGDRGTGAHLHKCADQDSSAYRDCHARACADCNSSAHAYSHPVRAPVTRGAEGSLGHGGETCTADLLNHLQLGRGRALR